MGVGRMVVGTAAGTMSGECPSPADDKLESDRANAPEALPESGNCFQNSRPLRISGLEALFRIRISTEPV